MESLINRFGETQTTWTSHKHPHNPDFMQVVIYMHIIKPNGESTLYWRLNQSSANDNHFIPDIELKEAISLYTDEEVIEVTEEQFQKWLANKTL